MATRSDDLHEFKISSEKRKKLAKKLAELQASQRATAKALGVGHMTINKDLKSVQNQNQNPHQ
jgi:IS30 family transposase